MKCPNCGEIIKEKKKMNFCGYCGANLKTGEKTFTSPEPRDNISINTNPERINDFTPKPAAPPRSETLDFGSPFERMVKENALNQAQSNPDFVPPFGMPVPNKETAPNQGPVSVQTTVAPPPFNSFQPADFTMSKPGEAPEQKIVTVEPPIIPDTPAFSAPVTPVVPPAPEAPVSPQQPAAPKSASPIASFDPSSLSMFDPYKMNNAGGNGGGAYEPLDSDPLDAKPVSISSFNERLSLLIEQTSQPYGSETEKKDGAPKNDQPEVKAENQDKGLDPALNIARNNVTMRNDTDDSGVNPITYMEYTKSTDRKSNENKYASFDFTVPEIKPASAPDNTQIEEDIREKLRKEEAKKAIDESVDSILDFTAHKKPLSESVSEKPEQSIIEETPAAPVAEAVKQPEPEPVKPTEPEPVPEPQPEPEPAKEKLINYVGQEKKAAVQMIKFKGLVPEIEYVDSDKDFGFVVAQSIPADTEVLPGTAVKLSVSAGTWSEWEENPMPVSPNNFIIETKTEFRKRSRTRTTDKRDTTDSSEYEGYTLTGTDQKFSEWETDQYYTAEAIPPGPTCEIVRVASGFKYAGWFNPANMNGMSFSSPDVANFFNTNLSGVKWMYEEIISEQNIKPDVKNWKLVTDNMNTTPAGDPMISNIFFSAHVLDGKSYAMKFGSTETEWYVYKRRNLLETIYHFEKEIISDWGEWSEWAETPLTGSEDCEVESRTLTRSRRKIPNN